MTGLGFGRVTLCYVHIGSLKAQQQYVFRPLCCSYDHKALITQPGVVTRHAFFVQVEFRSRGQGFRGFESKLKLSADGALFIMGYNGQNWAFNLMSCKTPPERAGNKFWGQLEPMLCQNSEFQQSDKNQDLLNTSTLNPKPQTLQTLNPLKKKQSPRTVMTP